MGNDSIENRAYLIGEEYSMFTEYSTNIINDEINRVTKKAYTRAKEIIDQYMDLLEAIVEVLMANKIVSEIELDKIWKSVVAKRNN